MLIDFKERRERKRDQLPFAHAPNRDRTCTLGACSERGSTPHPFGAWGGGAPTNDATQPGLVGFLLLLLLLLFVCLFFWEIKHCFQRVIFRFSWHTMENSCGKCWGQARTWINRIISSYWIPLSQFRTDEIETYLGFCSKMQSYMEIRQRPLNQPSLIALHACHKAVGMAVSQWLFAVFLSSAARELWPWF